MDTVVVSGSFDNIQSKDVRFLEEASKLGPVQVLLWSDEAVNVMTGVEPRFPLKERRYILKALRYVHKVVQLDAVSIRDELLHVEDMRPRMWVVDEDSHTLQKQEFCTSKSIIYSIIENSGLNEFPSAQFGAVSTSPNQKVVVTGCFDWFHSGHVRFFEETSVLGDLYVIVGHDENVRLLKGEGHPLFPEDERCYIVGSIGFVKQAVVSSGRGWMDAEPQIDLIKPDIYVVNEDGDQPEKREFSRRNGLKYMVLKRTPARGLRRRESTVLRGGR